MNEFDSNKQLSMQMMMFGVKLNVTDIVDCHTSKSHIKYSEQSPVSHCISNSTSQEINSKMFLSSPAPLKKNRHVN